MSVGLHAGGGLRLASSTGNQDEQENFFSMYLLSPLDAVCYSYRRAVIGSTRDARCAGISPAQQRDCDHGQRGGANTIGSRAFI